MKNLPPDDPKVTICVKNCTGFDPLSGYSFEIGFKEHKTLDPHPAYNWTNRENNVISSLSCDFEDFGGLHEKIDIDYKWSCKNGYHQNGKYCSGIHTGSSISFRHLLPFSKIESLFQF